MACYVWTKEDSFINQREKYKITTILDSKHQNADAYKKFHATFILQVEDFELVGFTPLPGIT